MLVLSLFAFSVSAESAEKLFKQGNALYKAGKYEEAAAAYEQIIKQEKQSAEVYYNLGNCYYKLQQPGKTILNYERALKLNPGDEDIQHNLKLANLHTVDKFQPVPQLAVVKWWGNFRNSQSSGGWATLAIVFLWISLLLAAVYLFLSVYRKLIFSLAVLLLLVSLSCLGISFANNSNEQNSGRGVSLSSVAYVKSSPDMSGTDVFIIHEGATFKILDNSEEWYKIRLQDGKVGWLTKNYFDKI